MAYNDDRYNNNNDNHDFTSDNRPNYEIHDDKNGITHINIYDGNPRDDHSSIHINFDSDNGTATIVDTSSGSKETTDISCFLTTACMRHMQENFDDNCEELTVLRKFRDKYVTKEDIKHYYEVAPKIVEEIDKNDDSTIVFKYIYDHVVSACVNAIKSGNYEFAYRRYKSSVLALEQEYIVSKENKVFIKK